MTKTPTCKICRRKLTSPESINRGIGPECAQLHSQMMASAGLTAESLGLEFWQLAKPEVSRWLNLAEKALLAGNRRDVANFRAQALRVA
jgi:uncharacterized protein DUF6011